MPIETSVLGFHPYNLKNIDFINEPSREFVDLMQSPASGYFLGLEEKFSDVNFEDLQLQQVLSACSLAACEHATIQAKGRKHSIFKNPDPNLQVTLIDHGKVWGGAGQEIAFMVVAGSNLYFGDFYLGTKPNENSHFPTNILLTKIKGNKIEGCTHEVIDKSKRHFFLNGFSSDREIEEYLENIHKLLENSAVANLNN